MTFAELHFLIFLGIIAAVVLSETFYPPEEK
jgi:hypothetical protein